MPRPASRLLAPVGHILHVGVKDALRKLAHEGRIFRENVSGRFVHLAADGSARTEQLRARQGWDAHPSNLSFGAGVRVVPDKLKAAIVLFFTLLGERQDGSPRGSSR